MQTIPVSNSTLASNALAVFVQQRYNLGVATNARLLKTGINHSYLITDGADKFVFRVYSLNWRTVTEIKEEIRLLDALKEKSLPISYALPGEDGSYLYALNAPEGLRYGVLFTFAAGGKLLNFPGETHYKVGEAMARMHQTDMELARVHYTPKVLLQDPFRYLNNFLSADTEEMQWMQSTQKVLLDILAKADFTQLRVGPVHMDIWFDNMNITDDGHINIFDFDFCGNGWQCLDIAYYVLQLHSTEKDEAERQAKKEGFLSGYESITKISDEEKRLLPALGVSMYFFYLGVQCQRFDNWSNVFLNEMHLKRFINLLVKKYYDDNVAPLLSVLG
ncbi:phosphotransferase [Mucilaginibacter pallidiroseus]|uniref:Phosphotransferase n=1 Tax=Mucilaginibacter pallidiroseus TaxID=2599295 RepID=A0A563U526_9SPHI|nr:phosphotransferase [Mucilaginibacter pallidiroseus]TWR26460.1 phosphotransferase [Mucilaginibacter pallidiroseus]